uniref:Uncharacterized protein n=1 Tax=Oryza punctata TaxID=4537 RepID=A0A0E0MQ41_ORYPU
MFFTLGEARKESKSREWGQEGEEYRAEDGLEEGGAGGVGDVEGIELFLQSSVSGGVAAAAAPPGVGAEGERLVERHGWPCKKEGTGGGKEADDDEEDDEPAAAQHLCLLCRR